MNKNLLYVAVIGSVFAILIAIVALVGGNQSASESFGGSTNFDTVEATALAIGSGCGNEASTCLGSTVAGLNFSSCSPVFSSPDLAASTTAVGICSDSTVVAGDKILVVQRFTGASTGLPTQGLFPAITVIASTTGAFGIQVNNFTGAATTTINSIYRTYSYLILR